MSEFNNHIKVNQAIELLQSLTSKYSNNDETIDGETIWTPLIGTISVLGDVTGSL